MADHAHVGALAAEVVANRLHARRHARLLLPTGRTPRAMYAALRARAAAHGLRASTTTVFALDEYLGVAPDDERAFSAQLRRELEGIDFRAVHTFDGTAADPAAECARHQRLLDRAPIDLAVLGLGRDGHVAFDEPGSRPDEGARVVALTERTRRDAAAAFGGLDRIPRRALTVGLRTLLAAREVLLLVDGAAKAVALRRALLDPADPAFPATLLRAHRGLTVVCDRAAAARLPPPLADYSDEVLVVLGHREPGVSAEHRISRESLGRLRRAERRARRARPRAAVLTGYTATGGLSEAEQMAAAWRPADVPLLLEVAGRDTAENATRSLPMILAMGGIRRVTVVTSAWHLRAPYFFAPFRRFGLKLAFDLAGAEGDAARMVRNELALMRIMRTARSRALGAMRLVPPLPAPDQGPRRNGG